MVCYNNKKYIIILVFMKCFSVYLPQDTNLEKAVFIRDGFSFSAFLFHIFWTLYNKLYFASLLILLSVVSTELLVYSGYLTNQTAILIQSTIIPMLCGFNGSYWLEKSLLRRKFEFCGSLIASSLLEAKMKKFSEYEEYSEENKVESAW